MNHILTYDRYITYILTSTAMFTSFMLTFLFLFMKDSYPNNTFLNNNFFYFLTIICSNTLLLTPTVIVYI